MSNILVTFLASFLIWVMFASLLLLWIIDGRIKKEQAIHAFIGSIVVWILAAMIKTFFPTIRPFYMNGYEALTLVPPSDASFPSMHSAVAFTIAFIVWLHDKKTGTIFVLMAILVALGRVLANVHYPIDVIGGAFFGVVCAIVMDNLHLFNFVKKLSRKK